MPLIPIFIQNAVSSGAANRLSAFNFCDPFDHILPFADGTVSALDRQYLWGMYTGIAADAPVAVVEILGEVCLDALDARIAALSAVDARLTGLGAIWDIDSALSALDARSARLSGKLPSC